ncbi:ribonuclease H-like domain-containing protein [Tanacetum coccineum]
MYENFTASSTESLDLIFNRFQKIISQLAILGETRSQEDLNLKFLRSLPPEWNTRVIVWRNKTDLDKMSLDDLYNNFKIIEQEVKRSVTSSSNSGSQNLAFISASSNTNNGNPADVYVSTASSSVNTVSTSDSAASLSDATVYAFIANQPKGSQIAHEDLEQIHKDDLELMDLKWQLALLSMRARRYFQKTGKKITIDGGDTAGFDKTKVECFNCHKLGHFARECRNPRSQENRSKNQDTSRRPVNAEETAQKAMLALDGNAFDWSFMSEEEVPTNYALMAFSDSEVQNNKTCSKTCLKSFKDLKSKYEKLRIELNKSESDLANYKRGLASVEEQLVFYKKNETSKSLDKILESQIPKNSKKGLGYESYNAVPPPPTGLFAPPTIDLSNSGLEEFKQPEFEGYGVKVNKTASIGISKEVKKISDAPIIEDWVSECDEDEPIVNVLKSGNGQPKPKQADQPRKVSNVPRSKRTNWNTLSFQKPGVGFQFKLKACFVCGSFSHLIKDCDFHANRVVQTHVLNNMQRETGQIEGRPVWNSAMRTNHQNFSNSRRNFAPTAVLNKSGMVPINAARIAVPVSTARPVNTAAPKSCVDVAKPRINAFQKTHSPTRKPFYQQTALKNRNLSNKVNTVKINSVNTAKDKRVTSAGKQGFNTVKPTECWVWRPKRNVIDHLLCWSALFEKLDRPFKAVYIPATARDTSEATCDTEYDADTYKMLANADPCEHLFKVLNPATGLPDEVFTACVIEHYREDQCDSSVVVVTASGETLLLLEQHHIAIYFKDSLG